MAKTVDEFLEDTKLRIQVPANQITFSNPNMISFSDRAMKEKVVPALMKIRQNFFTKNYEETCVAEQAVMSIPYRSIGRVLNELKLRNGTESTSPVSNLSLIEIADLHNYATTPGVPSGFYFRGDKFVLVPPPVSDDYQVLGWYPLQPSKHCLVEAACLVDSVDDETVTCSNVPETFTDGVLVDFVEAKSGSSILGMDVEITGVSGLDIVFASEDDVPTDLAAGDYICLKQKTPVVQLPDEAIPLLEVWTAYYILMGLSDFEGAAKLQAEAMPMTRDLQDMLSPRIKSEPVKICNRNGLLRGRGNSKNTYRGFTPE